MDEIILKEENGQVLASSRDVAEKFGKEHSKVKRSILALKEDIANFGEMFIPSYYIDSYGRKQDDFSMNRDGFSLIVMGFTGKKALEWKLKYINAFNQMEENLNQVLSLQKKKNTNLCYLVKTQVKLHMHIISLLKLLLLRLLQKLKNKNQKLNTMMMF